MTRLRQDMVALGTLEARHVGHRQSLAVFLNLPKEDREQPRLRAVGKDHTVALVLVNDFKQSTQVGLLAPVRFGLHRNLYFVYPKKILRRITEHDQPLSLR